jgi:hypothetical protein
MMRLRNLSLSILATAALGTGVLVTGCEKAKAPPVATQQDIETARQEAQRQVAEARAEASKDVKSAAKVSGADAAVVNEAKITGAYDVAMTKADGDRKVAVAGCQTLPADQQKACSDAAEAAYQSTAAAAKAARLAREH